MKLKDPYGVAIYSKENPAKIYMEYAYKCKDFKLNFKSDFYKYKTTKVMKSIDFFQDHYIDITKIDYKSLIGIPKKTKWWKIWCFKSKNK